MLEPIAIQASPAVLDWRVVHPLINHFPVVLFLVAPLFMIAAMWMHPEKGRPYLIAAFALMLLGTASAFLAVVTGEAAAQRADPSAAVAVLIQQHEHFAHITRDIFAILTLIFATILFLPRFLRREMSGPAQRAILLAFLPLYVAGTVILLNTERAGGRLVQELGIHAGTAPASQPASQAKPRASAKPANLAP